jgi:putative ABC transport system permease protein
LRRNIILTLCGLGLGTIATYAMGNLMQGLLFGVRANDSRIIFAAVVALGTISLVASYIPARRATSVDPMVSLREE